MRLVPCAFPLAPQTTRDENVCATLRRIPTRIAVDPPPQGPSVSIPIKAIGWPAQKKTDRKRDPFWANPKPPILRRKPQNWALQNAVVAVLIKRRGARRIGQTAVRTVLVMGFA